MTTGQGLLGNNMFAYCNNNPINCVDSSGQYAVATDIEIYGGGVAGIVGSRGGGGANAVSQEMARIGTTQNTSIGKRKFEEVWQDLRDAVTDYNSISDTFPALKIVEGGDDIKNGVNRIIQGSEMLFAPIPTAAEDVCSVGLIVYGVLEATGGLVKMIIGFDRL